MLLTSNFLFSFSIRSKSNKNFTFIPCGNVSCNISSDNDLDHHKSISEIFFQNLSLMLINNLEYPVTRYARAENQIVWC